MVCTVSNAWLCRGCSSARPVLGHESRGCCGIAKEGGTVIALTTWQYYKSFISLHGIVTGAVALPIVSLILPDSISSYAFPPLGNVEFTGRIGAVAFAVAATYVVYVS